MPGQAGVDPCDAVGAIHLGLGGDEAVEEAEGGVGGALSALVGEERALFVDGPDALAVAAGEGEQQGEREEAA